MAGVVTGVVSPVVEVLELVVVAVVEVLELVIVVVVAEVVVGSSGAEVTVGGAVVAGTVVVGWGRAVR